MAALKEVNSFFFLNQLVNTVTNSFESETSQFIKAVQESIFLPNSKQELAIMKQKYERLSVALTAILQGLV